MRGGRRSLSFSATMNDDKDQDSVWAKPRPDWEPFPAPPAPAGPFAAPQIGSGAGRWQIILALIIFPIPAAFWALVVAVIVGVIDIPTPIEEPCTSACLAVQDDVRVAYRNSSACDGQGRRVCFVPIGSVTAAELDELSTYYT